MKYRNKGTNKKGFTMAELMLAIAIIVILGALATVGVFRYLRSMRLLEMDNAAKELYFAAQNRITAELVSGDLGRLKPEEYSSDFNYTFNGTDLNVVLFPDVVKQGKLDTSLWNELLPFGSIDDTIRLNGSYIITYTFDTDSNLAQVWDVWYTAEWRGANHTFTSSELEMLYTNTRGDENKEARKNYGSEKAVIGHYGSEGITLERKKLAVTELNLVNDEVLYLTGKVAVDKEPSIPSGVEPQVNIIVEGITSGAIKTLIPDDSGISINAGGDGSFQFVLDDITQNDKRFSKLFNNGDNGKTFIPGEDIRVTVEVYSNSTLANIDKASAVDNSLFQYVNPKADGGKVEAGIGKIRHLQNLSKAVSGVDLGEKDQSHPQRLGIRKAQQTADLNWNSFTGFKLPGVPTGIGGSIWYTTDANQEKQTSNSFYPIDLKAAEGDIPEDPTTQENKNNPKNPSFLIYSGDFTVKKDDGTEEPSKHKISNLTVKRAADDPWTHAGLFGTIEADGVLAEGKRILVIEKLVTEGFEIEGSATAAALVANEKGAIWLDDISIGEIQNDDGTILKRTTIAATNGNAGGAVGMAVNGLDLWNVSVSESSITANSTTATSGNAGGLLGEHSGNNVHLTISGCSVTNSTTDKPVTGSAAAGGLVGSITNGIPTITNSYSTAIVSGNVAGGLVGTVAECGDGSEIKSCYVGGHVVNQTEPTKEKSQPVIYSSTDFNVTATANTGIAGGFIGSIDAAAGTGLTVEACYSTASASADLAGGFIGQLSGDGAANYSVSNCYAVGLVNDTTTGVTAENPDRTLSGAFVGNLADVNILAGNRYFELVNENMHAVGNIENPAGVIAAETSLETYNNFFSFGVDKEFSPYNDRLKTMFGTRYFLPTVKDLGGDDSMNTHVGDWQPVDTLVFNTKSSTPTEP